MYNPSRKEANRYWGDLNIFLQSCSKFNRVIGLRERLENKNDPETRDVFERCYGGDLEELEKTIREIDEFCRAALREFNRQCVWTHVSPIPDEQCGDFFESLMNNERRNYYKGVIDKYKSIKIPTVLSVEEIETKYQNICAKRREKLGGANYVG